MGVTLSIHFEDKEWIAWQDFERRRIVEIHYRCRVLKKISWKKLWCKFLESSTSTFAIAPPELIAIMEESVHGDLE